MDEVPEALQCLRKPRSSAGRTGGEEWVADPGGQREAVETIFLGRGEGTRNIQVQGSTRRDRASKSLGKQERLSFCREMCPRGGAPEGISGRCPCSGCPGRYRRGCPHGGYLEGCSREMPMCWVPREV